MDLRLGRHEAEATRFGPRRTASRVPERPGPRFKAALGYPSVPLDFLSSPDRAMVEQ